MKIDIIELFKDKKSRSIIILVIYIVFFVVLAILFRTNGNRTNNYVPDTPTSPIDNYCIMANYEYKTDYEMDTRIFSIEGKNFRTDNYFKLDDQEYYLKDGRFYLYSVDRIGETGLDFDFYDVKTICDLLNKATLVSKSEDYEKNATINKYSVYDDTRDTNIYISTVITNNIIDNVLLDLSQDNYKYTIDIKYSNIGQVTNFTSMFDEEKIIKGVEE